jgi:hypothetical protein
MANLNTLSSSARLRAVIYGDPKTGKTAAAAALATSYKLTVLSLENSIDTFLNTSILPAEYRKNINLIQIPDTQENPIASATVVSLLSGIPTSICHAHGVVNCVKCKATPEAFDVVDLSKFASEDVLVIDSITQLADSVRNNICKSLIAKDAAPTWDEYKKEGLILSKVFNRLQNLNCHLVAIAHQEIVEMPDGTKKLVPSAGTKNFAKGIAGFFTTVVQASVVNRKYKLASNILDAGNAPVAAANGYRLMDGDTLHKLFPQ